MGQTRFNPHFAAWAASSAMAPRAFYRCPAPPFPQGAGALIAVIEILHVVPAQTFRRLQHAVLCGRQCQKVHVVHHEYVCVNHQTDGRAHMMLPQHRGNEAGMRDGHAILPSEGQNADDLPHPSAGQ